MATQRPSSRRQFLQSGLVVTSMAYVGGSAHTTWAWQEKQPKQKSGRKPLLVHSQEPMNAEPVLDELVKSWITPNDQFYIRSHAPTPKIDPASFKLSIEGLVDRPFEISLKELKTQYGSHSVFATLTCAGNRRSEHSQVKEVSGVQWQSGAIGNARWTGPRLGDLLKRAGLQAGAKHVWFEGLDQVQRESGVIPFGASVPIEKALAHHADDLGVLLAYEMNDEPLTPDHGFPLRTVVPGYIGARSVKWLGKVIVSDRPSDNHYVATAYKLVTESTDEQWQGSEPLYQYIMNSVTCVPSANGPVQAGPLKIQGYALPPGQRGSHLQKIEVSLDDGQNWQPARFASPRSANCWQLWEATVNVSDQTESILVRATDNRGEAQPQKAPWNLKGYMFNAWHRRSLKDSKDNS